jgi:hypothetical protein
MRILDGQSGRNNEQGGAKLERRFTTAMIEHNTANYCSRRLQVG